MERVFLVGLTEENMLAILGTTRCTAMDSTPGKMVDHLRVSTKAVKNMGMEFISIAMAKSMKVVGKMDSSTAKESTPKKIKLEKGSGKTAKESSGFSTNEISRQKIFQ